MDKLINMELDLETEKIKSKVREADEKGQTDAALAAGELKVFPLGKVAL